MSDEESGTRLFINMRSARDRLVLHSASVVYEKHPPETLPVRGRSSLPGGRHRRPASAELPPDAPALVLAVPRSPAGGPRAAGPSDQVATDIASLTRAARADIDIRVGHLYGHTGDGTTLVEVLRDLAAKANGADRDTNREPNIAGSGSDAVVVPLLTGSNPAAYDAIRSAVTAGGVTATITEPLGPHPLLAEALHVRLAERGLARADRIRQFSIGASVDGVVVATLGGAAAVQEADITAVLLAARLAVPVVAAALDAVPGVADQVDRLRAAGAARIALAPHVIGPEADPDALAAVAAQVDAGCSAPLGAHEAIVRLVNLRYEVALEELTERMSAGAAAEQPASQTASEYGSEEEVS
jgi:hypothetical protein